MEKKMSVSQTVDERGRKLIHISKTKGSLTQKEICEALNHFDFNQCADLYVLLLNCANDEEAPNDEILDFFRVKECRNCQLRMMSVEKHIHLMREETEREIKKPSLSDAARTAWYWTFIGSVDMAFQLGFISDEERQTFYDSVQHLKT